ncbi:MAG: hypothetical protein HRT47_05465 [Candidatus Caenarcaniphilales bacterium]|nr:hypothetical protein [Candidatus Caenarcaniphilales bacterium]
MKKDDVFLVVICILLCICICEKALAKKRFSPLSKLRLGNTLYSPGDTLTVQGQGFIPRLDSIYHIKLANDLNSYSLSLEGAKLDEIKLLLPNDIAYGDYDLSIKLKSNYLKSKRYIIDGEIEIRPAPLKLDFEINEVFLSKWDLHNFVLNSLSESLSDYQLKESDVDFYINGELFDFNLMNLIEGESSLAVGYNLEGFNSILSNSVNIMFLSEELYAPELEVLNLNPLEAKLARLDTQAELSVNDYLAANDHSAYTYLRAFPGIEIFKTDRDLKKLLITKLKVTGEEYAVIKNNSADFFSFDGCSLADTLKLRYSFSDEIELAPKSLLKIKGNLGLNNSSADKLQIICEYGGEEPEFVVEDVFSYDEVDEGGFAVKSE